MNPQSHSRVDVEDSRRLEYASLLAAPLGSGVAGHLAMGVSRLDLDREDESLRAAAGLGLSLVRLGWEVELVSAMQSPRIAADVFLAAFPDADPALAPPGAWRVAWVRDRVSSWLAAPHLPAYDQLLVASAEVAEHLRLTLDKPVDFFAPGVDTTLFLTRVVAERGSTAVFVARKHRDQTTTRTAVRQCAAAELQVLGGRHLDLADPRYNRQETVSWFAHPDVYRQAALVVVDERDERFEGGIVPLQLLEAAACGCLPVVNDAEPVRVLGLPSLPHSGPESDLGDVLAQLRADPEALAARAGALQQAVREGHSWDTRAEAFTELVRRARSSREAGAVDRRAWYFFPDWSRANPYQAMLYQRLSSGGAYPVPVKNVLQHLEYESQTATPSVLHIHWTGPILQWAEGPFSAHNALTDFVEHLEAFVAHGNALVWTIHNVLPHDGRHLWAERRLARKLAEHASIIHVLSEATFTAVGSEYELDPKKAVVVEHSSYVGVYPDLIGREEARGRLGIAQSAKVMVALGGVRPYKGLNRLFDAFVECAMEDASLYLLVAGRPADEAGIADLQARCVGHPRVISHFDYIPDDELQIWLRAADLAVLPYSSILNSGAFWLAQTYDLPVVAPRAGALAQWESASHVRLFVPESDDSLLEAMRDALRRMVSRSEGARHARDQAHLMAREHTPERMAGDFVTRVVEPLLGRDGE